MTFVFNGLFIYHELALGSVREAVFDDRPMFNRCGACGEASVFFIWFSCYTCRELLIVLSELLRRLLEMGFSSELTNGYVLVRMFLIDPKM